MLRIVWAGPLDVDPENDSKIESGRPALPVQALPQAQILHGDAS
jgi:cytochrome d ubiquinol oxidase subunit I